MSMEQMAHRSFTIDLWFRPSVGWESLCFTGAHNVPSLHIEGLRIDSIQTGVLKEREKGRFKEMDRTISPGLWVYRYIYIYLYIYMWVCESVCVCVCLRVYDYSPNCYTNIVRL